MYTHRPRSQMHRPTEHDKLVTYKAINITIATHCLIPNSLHKTAYGDRCVYDLVDRYGENGDANHLPRAAADACLT